MLIKDAMGDLLVKERWCVNESRQHSPSLDKNSYCESKDAVENQSADQNNTLRRSRLKGRPLHCGTVYTDQ